jgi:hypothetical protein
MLSLEGQLAFEFIGLLKHELPNDGVLDELSEQYWTSFSPTDPGRIVLEMPAESPYSFFVVVANVLEQLEEDCVAQHVRDWGVKIRTQQADWRKQQKHLTDGNYPGWVEEIDAGGQLQLGDTL